MSQAAEIKLAEQRLSVLELAQALGNVAAACKQRGMSRTQYYQYKRRYQTHGIEGLVDLHQGRVLRSVRSHESPVTTTVVIAEGRVISASEDAGFNVWDLESTRRLAGFHSHPSACTVARVAPNGRRVAAVLGDGALMVWETGSREVTARMAFDAPLNHVAFAGGGTAVVASDAAGNIHCLRCCGA